MGGKYEVKASNDCGEGYDIEVFTNSWLYAQLMRIKARKYKYRAYIVRNI